MSEELAVSKGTKEEVYTTLLTQIEILIADETDWLANLANVTGAIWQTFGFFWVGFYRVQGDELILGPFQGPIACTRIAKGKGVCGTAWEKQETLVVPDVNAFPGHIACASASQSEIVVPVFNDAGEVIYVLDIDSDTLDTFDQTDKFFLEKIAALLN